jgi:hypothetical protein
VFLTIKIKTRKHTKIIEKVIEKQYNYKSVDEIIKEAENIESAKIRKLHFFAT